MEKKLKKKRGRILALSLILVMAVGFMPQMTEPIYAANGDAAIVCGSESVLKSTANTDDAQTVWYADKAWRVISYDGTGNGNTKPSGAMTLFSSGILADRQQFNPYQNRNNDYKDSVLQGVVNGLFTSLFSEEERHAVIERELAVDEFQWDAYSTGVSGTATTGYLWPLSTAEAGSLPSDSFRQTGSKWWLRSPGDFDGNGAGDCAAYVHTKGYVYSPGYYVESFYAVRPAFDLNLESVLFTSAAEGGKSSGTDGALTKVGNNTTSEWKLTLKDDGSENAVGNRHKDFIIDSAQITYDAATDAVTVPYSGAATGDNEYISAIIKDSSDSIKYYGRIAKTSHSADASVTIDTAGKLGDSDTLYVFNEQYNGDATSELSAKTDYASALQKVDIPAHYQIVYDPGDGGSGTMDPMKVVDGQTYTFPKCTFTPSKNKTFDHWTMSGVDGIFYKGGNVTISGNCAQNGVITVTAHWKKNSEPTPKPVAKTCKTPLTSMTAKGDHSVTIAWVKVEGAAGYEIFFARCDSKGGKTTKKVKTIKAGKTFKWTKSGLKKGTAYKAYVKAYAKKNGKKQYIGSSPVMHMYTSGESKKYTNAKSISVNKTKVKLTKGETCTLKAKVKKLKKNKKLMPSSHVATVRYLSTDKSIATVTKGGKIMAKKKGTCYVYAYAHNGVCKKVKVAVK